MSRKIKHKNTFNVSIYLFHKKNDIHINFGIITCFFDIKDGTVTIRTESKIINNVSNKLCAYH